MHDAVQELVILVNGRANGNGLHPETQELTFASATTMTTPSPEYASSPGAHAKDQMFPCFPEHLH